MWDARNKRVIVLAAAAAFAAIGQATAQQPPASPLQQSTPAAEDSEAEDEIVVVARRGDQVRIDRRDYAVGDSPAAQATEALDILGRIPSVSVAPSGEIRLLGGEGVTIQLNGQAVPSGNIEQVLRSLSGNDIERIEVTTNPPASQSAASSAGIINIVTRDRFLRGFAGTLLGNVNTQGSTQFNATPSFSNGPLTLSGRFNYNNNLGEQSFTRHIQNFTTGSIIDEQGGSEYDNTQYNAQVQLSYRFDPRRRLTVSANYFGAENSNEQSVEQRSNLGLSNTQFTPFRGANDGLNGYFSYKHTGENGSELEVSGFGQVFEFANVQRPTITPSVGPATQVEIRSAQDSSFAELEIEYERPFGGSRLFTAGASFDDSRQSGVNSRETLTGFDPADYRTTLDGVQQTMSAYGTYQFATGEWIWQPGLRAEHYRREVIGVGGESDATETTLFPSLHVRRPLTSRIDLDLNYSSRIQRPDFFQLDPTVRISPDGLKGNSGNPNLEPTTTDAYEVNLTYQNRGSTFSVTFFDRMSEDIVSPFTELTPGGVLLTRPVNAGESEQRGLQTILRAPLGENLRYSLSANFLDRGFDVIRNGAITQQSQFEYSGNAQIEWRDANQALPGADSLQFDLQFQGPRGTLQGETDETFMANLTWRRRFTDRLVGTARWADVFDTNTTEASTRTDDVFDRVENVGVSPRVFFTLSYQFGSLTERPPQQDQAPNIPPPMQAPAP